ncbi:MAG TPA: hypothetical protein VF271_10250 [Rhodanobacteraceae bacterium]
MTDMTMQALAVPDGRDVFDQILEADAPLITLETTRPDALLEKFRQRVRRSGETFYVWQEGEGLCSLRETGLRIPGSLRVSDTLRYVLKSRHFGIYLMGGLTTSLTQSDVALMRRFVQTRADFVRRVVLLAQGPELARRLGDLTVVIRDRQAAQGRLRLRGGRWVN